MDGVAGSGKPDGIDHGGNGDADHEFAEDTQEEGLAATIELDTSDAEDEGLGQPDDEDGEDGSADRVGLRDGEANGMERPAWEAVSQKCEHGHD